MSIVRQISMGDHMIEVLDISGYYLVDKVPVVSGDLKVEDLSETELLQIFNTAANIWQPRVAITRREEGYFRCLYAKPYDDNVWNGRAVIDGILVFYDKENMDVQNSGAKDAIHRIADRMRHSGISVWKHDGELFGNIVSMSDWSIQVQHIFENIEGDVSWRV